MRKAGKIALIAGGVVAGMLAILAVAVKIVISPEMVKKTVLPIVEKRLHRQVRVGDVQISLFSGISLENLAVMEKEGTETFVSAGKARLRYQFWPLLAKRVVVDEVRLEKPRIRVVRLPDGTFNYSDITAKKEGAPPEAKPEEKGEMHLLVSKVAVTEGEVRFEDRKATPPATFVLTGAEFSAHDIALDKPFPFTATVRIPGLTVAVEGKAADVATKPSVDATVRLRDVDLRQLVVGLPPSLTAKAKALDPAGGISASFHVAGPVSAGKALLKDGEVKLAKVEATVSGQRPSLSGTIAIRGDSVSAQKLELALGGNKALVGFQVANLFGKPLSVTSSITADRFDLDPFLKKDQKGAAEGSAAPAEPKPEPGPLNLPVRATGTAQLGQTVYKGLPVTKLLLKYRLENNILTVDELSGNVAGGSFSGSARVDLATKGFAYAARTKVQGVRADQAVPAFAPKAAGTVFGTLSLDADLSGKGTASAAIKKNLSGRGTFAISDGKLTGAGLVQELARFVNVERLRVVEFQKFAGSFRIDNGKVAVDSDLAGRDIQVTPKGTAGLDKTLDMSLVARLSPALTGSAGKGDVGKFLTDDKGWGVVPLKVTGTFSAPKFRLDTSRMGEQLKSKAREKVEQTIQEKLLKKKEGEPQRPEQELLEKGLKGIFGK